METSFGCYLMLKLLIRTLISKKIKLLQLIFIFYETSMSGSSRMRDKDLLLTLQDWGRRVFFSS